MTDEDSFVGRGWAFPVRISPRGGLALLSGSADIDAAIRMIIETAPGERVMRPEFGCRIWDHIFDSTDTTALGQMAQAVQEALARWEPRAVVEELTVGLDPQQPNRVLIELSYRIKATNDRRNLVHPFYVIAPEPS